MRAALTIAVALALAGCEHMYGGMDRGRLVSTAVHYAEARQLQVQDPSSAVILDGGDTWDVNLDPPCDTCVGGPIIVWISKITGRATGLLVMQ
ncbi:hypothetical protein [Phenylobacterium sp.]|uniref:hypothetical protein n=1 Tax=Phenylobacterium sp. TaxID=1871053 RepID=UPI003D2C2CC4